jgi:hypothetical protein
MTDDELLDDKMIDEREDIDKITEAISYTTRNQTTNYLSINDDNFNATADNSLLLIAASYVAGYTHA